MIVTHMYVFFTHLGKDFIIEALMYHLEGDVKTPRTKPRKSIVLPKVNKLHITVLEAIKFI